LKNAALRIAFLTNCIPPYLKPVLDLLTARHTGFRIFVSTPIESNCSWKVDWSGLDVVVQKTITLRGRWRHPRAFEEPLEVHFPLDTVNQLRRFDPDIVISNELGFRTLLAVLYTKIRRGARVISWTDVNDTSEQHGRGFARNLLRRVLRNNIHAFLALGSGGVRYLRSLGADEKKIFRFVYTTDVQRFAKQELGESGRRTGRVLYVGRLIQLKGLQQFIEALSRWSAEHPTRQIEFVLAGEGPLRDNLERIPVPENLRVTFLGPVAYENLPDIYAQADLFAFPTLLDLWGVVVNEALAAGLPVLGSVYAQAVTELVQPGRTGWIFHPDDAEEMYRSIDQSLTTPPEELQRMRAEARETALRLTPSLVADLIDDAIEGCASIGTSRRVHA
jgi:hypothetical protein